MNGKFYERLKNWVTIKPSNPELGITSGTPSTTDPERQEDNSGTLKNEEDYIKSSGSGRSLKADNSDYNSLYDSDSEVEGFGSKKSDQKNQRISKSSKVPQLTKSWNQMVDQDPGIQQILYILAQNQLQQNQMKLPYLKLKPFNGDILQYRAFKAQFARAIKTQTGAKLNFLFF